MSLPITHEWLREIGFVDHVRGLSIEATTSAQVLITRPGVVVLQVRGENGIESVTLPIASRQKMAAFLFAIGWEWRGESHNKHRSLARVKYHIEPVEG